ncbi:MAG TPA: hypothetical protein VK937_11670, partial [Candidatus Limnocylindria bacterium]|nr:hypothetical protein [Candidatus Limnocylindria bacterium]
MSRISPEAQRRWHSPESRVSREREDHAIGARTSWAWGGGWDFWVVRAFLVACTGAVSYTLGPFGLRGLPAAGVGFLIALVVLLAELRLRRVALSGLLGGAFGAVLGVFAALLVTLVISRTDEPEPTKSFLEFAALFAFGYLGVVLGSGRGGELRVGAVEELLGKKSAPAGSVKLLDTSVLIDGRIADICEAQFLGGVLGVPQFVLHELQMVADSSEPLKRQRGRRGLEVLQRIQKMPRRSIARTVLATSPNCLATWRTDALARQPHRILKVFAERRLARQLRNLLDPYPALGTAHPIQFDDHRGPIL